MGKVSGNNMVLLDDEIKDRSKIHVGVNISSIDAAVLVIKLHSAGNRFSKGKA